MNTLESHVYWYMELHVYLYALYGIVYDEQGYSKSRVYSRE